MYIEYSDVIRGRIVRRSGVNMPLTVGTKSISPKFVIVPYHGILWDDLMDAVLNEIEDDKCEHDKLYHSINEYYDDLIANTTVYIKVGFQLRCAYALVNVTLKDGRKKSSKVVLQLNKDEYHEFIDRFFAQSANDAGMDEHFFDKQRDWAYSPSMFGSFN